MVGINVRTIGSFADVVKYALTLPSASDSIHLLPIWEPGVVESLYGIVGWNLNSEFFSQEMLDTYSYLDDLGRQLRAATNLLHVMGKSVGFDVIPHTDRFSEIALGQPSLFEWMRVRDGEIVDHADSVEEEVEEVIWNWLVESGSATDERVPSSATALFSLEESERLRLLFGNPADRFGRNERRVDLIKRLVWFGLQPVPATMGVPFRGIHVDHRPEATVVDHHGMVWHDYVMNEPQFMSRVFSPLARYKLYERVDGNTEWVIDFDRPRVATWDYLIGRYQEIQQIGNFDFMRGDMSHVQMRPDGVPPVVDDHYDIMAAIKKAIQRTTPHFAYFAETFLPARDVFQFGEELDHLDASLADATLGDLQGTIVGDHEYLRRFRRYLDDLATRRCAPSYTVFTADKDDPRFDAFYRAGNELRYLTALLLTDMPSYTGLGFEIRDIHESPVANEFYTKLFVFREDGDTNVFPSKARHGGKYLWGENGELFDRINEIRLFAESILGRIAGLDTVWLVHPDATTLRGTVVWTQGPVAHYVVATNADLEHNSGFFGIPNLDPELELHEVFSTHGPREDTDDVLHHNGFFHRLANLRPGEGRVYEVRLPRSMNGF